MDTYHAQPCLRPLSATVTLPGSKSITNRALVAAALADGTSILSGALLANDTELMINALGALGVPIAVDDRSCTIEVSGCGGHLPESTAKLLCGNSGTVMRFCTALVSLGHGRYELDGVKRMRERPIGALVEVLRALGAGVEYPQKDGYPPIIVHAGGLDGGQIAFPSTESSQHVSAVLLTSPYARRDVLMEVSGQAPSRPYLKMTTAVMERFGVSVVEQYDPREIRFVVPAPQRYRATNYAVEPDASNASYFLAAPAVAGGTVTVKGLGSSSIQGDVRFVDVLERLGCRIERCADKLTVHGPPVDSRLNGIDVDLNDMPDVVQTLAVVALFAEGATTIRNVANLRVKETDRLAALSTELTKLGATIEQRPDGLTIHPPGELTPVAIDTYDDHRMAMSFALAGLKCSDLVINDPKCCAKTFPDFFDRFERLGD